VRVICRCGFFLRDFESLHGERTGHDSIREVNLKFAGAVKARYVLVSRLGGSGVLRGNFDFLPHFAVGALNGPLTGRDSGHAVQSGNQIGASRGFRHKAVSPGLGPDSEAWGIVDRQEHNLCRGRNAADFRSGRNAIHARHVDIHEDDFRLHLDDFFDSFLAVLGLAADLQGVPIKQGPDR
jgi:hypothetical protein